MGKLDHDPQIQHFSHPHPLELIILPDNITLLTSPQNSPVCSSCKYPQSGFMYSCNLCNFNIHLSCSQFPKLITHPSHPNHALTLLSISNYPGGQFNCDACNHRGNGFSYHCTHCDFDLHVVCAAKPLSVEHPAHAHALGLAFCSPYDTKGFSCDICKKIGSKQWLYRCGACEFDAHLHCATGTQPPPTPQAVPMGLRLLHHHSFPGPVVQQSLAGPGRMNNYYTHSASTGSSMMQQPGKVMPQQQQQSYNPVVVQQQQSYNSVAAVGPSANPSTGGGIMNSLVQGLVEGAAQTVGQTMMQTLIGGGGGGGGGSGSGSGGDGSSSSIFDTGSTFVIDDSGGSENY